MKKQALVIGIISSAHEGSNSAVLVREALKGAEKMGMKIEEIYLPEFDLDFCTGCLTCMKTGKCRMADGFNELRDKLYEADGIIWGSPTYGGAPNAIMKNFIDRLVCTRCRPLPLAANTWLVFPRRVPLEQQKR